MRILKKTAISASAACLLAFGVVVGAGGSALAADGPDDLVTGCIAQFNTIADGSQPNCEAIGGTISLPTEIVIYVDTDELGSLIAEQPGQGMDTSWTLSCVVNGTSVSVPGTYDVTSTSQAPYTTIDLQTAVGSPNPNQCSVEDLTVQTALPFSPDTLSKHAPSGHRLDGRPLVDPDFTVGVAAVGSSTVTGAIYQAVGKTSGGAQAELCADDTANGNAGSKIQSFQCRNDLADSFTRTSVGQLVHNGDCVGLSGHQVILSACTAGKTAQEWLQSAVGTTVRNRSTGTCLTAPSVKSGIQLTVASCGSGTSQKWQLPPASAAPVQPSLSGASLWQAVRSLK